MHNQNIWGKHNQNICKTFDRRYCTIIHMLNNKLKDKQMLVKTKNAIVLMCPHTGVFVTTEQKLQKAQLISRLSFGCGT